VQTGAHFAILVYCQAFAAIESLDIELDERQKGNHNELKKVRNYSTAFKVSRDIT